VIFFSTNLWIKRYLAHTRGVFSSLGIQFLAYSISRFLRGLALPVGSRHYLTRGACGSFRFVKQCLESIFVRILKGKEYINYCIFKGQENNNSSILGDQNRYRIFFVTLFSAIYLFWNIFSYRKNKAFFFVKQCLELYSASIP
jgi:hypothetical protein